MCRNPFECKGAFPHRLTEGENGVFSMELDEGPGGEENGNGEM